jgi:hypothetical protein
MHVLSLVFSELRTLVGVAGTSQSCQIRTHAPQQESYSIISSAMASSVGANREVRRFLNRHRQRPWSSAAQEGYNLATIKHSSVDMRFGGS